MRALLGLNLLAALLLLLPHARFEAARAERTAVPATRPFDLAGGDTADPPEPAEESPAEEPKTAPSDAREAIQEVVEDEDEEVEGEPVDPPADPVEKGPCSLFLRVHDAATGEPVEAVIHLYRLDAPGNDHWTRGDQLQAELRISKNGRAIADLPADTYRVACLDQPPGSGDEPAFEVSGETTERTIEVRIAPEFDAWLTVADERGSPLARGQVRRGGSHYRRADAIDWVVARKRRDPDAQTWIGLGGGGSGSGSVPVEADAEGRFRLRGNRPDTRGTKHATTHMFVVEGRSTVRVEISGEAGTPRAWFGISHPIAPYRDVIFLPDGRLAADAGAYVTATTSAVTGGLAEAQRQPVRVSCWLRGYEPLRFEVPAGTAPAAHTMALKNPRKSAAASD